jgi:L-fuculose-phosphate aldolase
VSGRALRLQLVELARLLWERGWVANHDGNLTARDGAGFVATPTATSKRLVTEPALVTVDAKGAVTGGRGRVFGEIGLHLAVYERRPDVGAVVHAHPPSATAIACGRGNPIERPFIAEALVSLGPIIPKVPFAPPGEAARAALAPWCEHVDAVLLGSHGVMAWGVDLEQALLRLELVEHLAKIAIAAVPLGGVEPLPGDCVSALLAARAKAGLGRAGDRAAQVATMFAGGAATLTAGKPVVACAPAPHASVATIAPGGSGSARDVAAIVRDEVLRALGGK